MLRDGLGLTSYLQIQVMQGDTPFGLRHYWKSHFVESLPDELIDQTVEERGDVVLFEPMHGAATRVPAGATAFGRRETLLQREVQWRPGRTQRPMTNTSLGHGEPLHYSSGIP